MQSRESSKSKVKTPSNLKLCFSYPVQFSGEEEDGSEGGGRWWNEEGLPVLFALDLVSVLLLCLSFCLLQWNGRSPWWWRKRRSLATVKEWWWEDDGGRWGVGEWRWRWELLCVGLILCLILHEEVQAGSELHVLIGSLSQTVRFDQGTKMK